MAVSLSTAQAHLDAWLAADLAVATGQSYQIDGRMLTRAHASEIRENITRWTRAVEALTAEQAGATSPGIRVATWG